MINVRRAERSFRCSLLVGLLAVGACASDPGAVGVPCDTRGSTEECVAGAICGYAGGEDKDTQICIEICENDAACQSGSFCKPVSGSSLKACRPPDAT